MALSAIHKETVFGVGDRVKVAQKVKEGGRLRLQIFDGLVIALKDRQENKSFTVRRIGEAGIGIERIFPLNSPLIEAITVVKKGTRGVRRAKLYYTRGKSPKQIEQIFTHAKKHEQAKSSSAGQGSKKQK